MNNKELLGAVERMIGSIGKKKIVLIGDFCLDVYFHVKSEDSEASLETGYDVRRVYKFTDSLGGAGNVYANLCDLGVGMVIPVGVIGNDMFGAEMLRLMRSFRPEVASLTVQSEGWTTPAYMKPIVDGKERERIDTGLKNRVSDDTVDLLAERMREVIPLSDAVIINQQLEDTIYTERLIKELNSLAKEYAHIPFIVDSRTKQVLFKGMWHKLNTHEIAAELGIALDPMKSFIPENDLKEMMKQYKERTGDPVIVSRGEYGAIAYDGEFRSAEGLSILSELDTVGAGDSFLSGFTLSMSVSNSLEESLHIGNSVSGVTIQKLHQTGTCTPEELRKIVACRDLIFNSDAMTERISEPFVMEVITDLKDIENRPAIEYAVFDHDGTISVLREGWEEVMEECMLNAVTGGKELDSNLIDRIRNSNRDFIVRSTGIQTINQMVMLVDIVRKWGLVAEEEILTPVEYKKIYNDALLAFIAKRIDNVRRGLLTPADVTVVGSIEFLKTLAENGVKLYLASGTDQDDVRKEAELLGYSDYFTGGIFGSVGDMNNDPKRQVLNNIIASENVDTSRLVIFGDGPVEMRVARTNGALAVGIQSNEVRRYGWNEVKHSRLLHAGADILIPDFMEYNRIASLLLKKEL